MPDKAELIYFDGDSPADYRDTVTMKWQVHYEGGVSQFDYFNALQRFTAIEGMPQRRQKYVSTETLNVGVNIYALHHHGVMRDPKDAKSLWDWTVTFGPPPTGAPIAEDGGGDNNGEPDQNQNPYSGDPTQWGPEINVEYYDTEVPVTDAKCTVDLPHGDGSGGVRPSTEAGPLVNAVGQQHIDRMYRTKRIPVLVVRKNYPKLESITKQNVAFADSTNSDTYKFIGPRRMEYLLTESLGRVVDSGVSGSQNVYWPGVTKIALHKTTDIEIDNVGFQYWDDENSKIVKAVDDDGNEPSEPINLNVDGTRNAESNRLVFRDLEEKAYAGLFEVYVEPS
ncbi:MAG: hypothetical protein AAGJ46_20890 [Planctomycetota bacterium]